MADKILRKKAEEKLGSELQKGKEEYEEEWLPEICEILVEAGEFESVEECKEEGAEEAKRAAQEWAEEYPEEMAEYLR